VVKLKSLKRRQKKRKFPRKRNRRKSQRKLLKKLAKLAINKIYFTQVLARMSRSIEVQAEVVQGLDQAQVTGTGRK